MIEYVGKCLLIENFGKKLLIVGDLHLGYEEFLNNSGVFVSRKLFEEVLRDFDEIFKKTGNVDKVILLGDVKHQFGKIVRQEWNDFGELVKYLSEKSNEIIIVKGNHDKIIEPIAKRSGLEVFDYYIEENYCFFHGDKTFPQIYDKNIKTWVMGHWHPAIGISDEIKTEKYKCYLVGKYKKREVVIVPSFFEGSKGTNPTYSGIEKMWGFDLQKFEVKVIQDENLEVLSFGQLGRIT